MSPLIAPGVSLAWIKFIKLYFIWSPLAAAVGFSWAPGDRLLLFIFVYILFLWEDSNMDIL